MIVGWSPRSTALPSRQTTEPKTPKRSLTVIGPTQTMATILWVLEARASGVAVPGLTLQ